MAAKKKKKKPAAPKKKTAAKKPAPKKKAVAQKKKAAPKKPKAAAKKTAPAKAKPQAAAPKAEATTPAWTKFPPVLEALVEWVNEGRAGEVDFEMYASFNEQYKPSDWTRDPKTDEELFTFGMDGSGGQVAIWRTDTTKPFDALPVVFMGSEGEVKPMATSLPKFLYLLASGLGPIEAFFDGEPNLNEEMMEWLRGEYPNAKFGEASEILEEAASELAHFEEHLMSQVPAS